MKYIVFYDTSIRSYNKKEEAEKFVSSLMNEGYNKDDVYVVFGKVMEMNIVHSVSLKPEEQESLEQHCAGCTHDCDHCNC